MRKIDDPHHAEGEGKADGNKVEYCPDRKPVNNGMNHLLTAPTPIAFKTVFFLSTYSQTP